MLRLRRILFLSPAVSPPQTPCLSLLMPHSAHSSRWVQSLHIFFARSTIVVSPPTSGNHKSPPTCAHSGASYSRGSRIELPDPDCWALVRRSFRSSAHPALPRSFSSGSLTETHCTVFADVTVCWRWRLWRERFGKLSWCWISVNGRSISNA
jgi:hypothetical protein